jgi:hypothetical protein
VNSRLGNDDVDNLIPNIVDISLWRLSSEQIEVEHEDREATCVNSKICSSTRNHHHAAHQNKTTNIGSAINVACYSAKERS